jgi:hypothetical protein
MIRHLALLAAAASMVSDAFAADPPVAANRQMLLSVQEIMESIIDPSADVLWTAVGTVVDNKGFHDALPKTPAQWRGVRNAAVRIIEGSNLLMVPGRPAAPPGTKSEVPGVELEPTQIATLIAKNRRSFDGFALTLQQVAAEALRAADSRNGEMLMEAGGRMEEACEGCHQSFWYPYANSAQSAGRLPARR